MKVRRLAILCLGGLTLLVALAAERTTLPVTTAKGRAADLVRKWWSDGTAAGNIGDYYDNRDRGHAPLDVKQYPQLSVVTYSEQEKNRRLDYAGARTVRTNVVMFGNSSTASNVEEGGGSNTRTILNAPGGAAMLHAQYRGNNLFAYPEHHDHDPGGNGGEGYGDLFPINTPYVYTSQGSSRSEMAFVRALPLTLAAFRPEVKKRLVENGMLMPAVQMILRRSLKNASGPADYLTGRAHPTVFEEANIDDEAMVTAAQAITLQTLPPLAQLQIVEEDSARMGIDFFDFQPTEKYADTPCAIGRIGRNVRFWRRMVVSADSSFDLNARPLAWHWAVLRGDTNRVRIKPLNARGSIVEIQIGHHERRPLAPGSGIESSRVDIGCFAHNGAFFSPPAFLCVYFLASEERGYDADGRLIDVGYKGGELEIDIASWPKLFSLLAGESLAAKFVKDRVSDDAWNALVGPAADYDSLRLAQEEAAQAERAAQLASDAINKSGDKDEKRAGEERKRAAAAKTKAAREALRQHLEPARLALMAFVDSSRTNLDFLFSERQALEKLYAKAPKGGRGEFDAARASLGAYGLFAPGKGVEVALNPARSHPAPLEDRLTPSEKTMVERLNTAALKALILPEVLRVAFEENYDGRTLSARKDWRDVYRYDAEGKMIGWTRYSPDHPPAQFRADGRLEDGTAPRYDLKRQAAQDKFRRATLQWTRGS